MMPTTISGQGHPTSSEGTHRRILIVDDNPDILDVFKSVFSPEEPNSELDSLEAELFGGASAGSQQQAGFLVDTASQGYEGYLKVVSAVQEGSPYSLAFVDMRMPPGWDGVETIVHMLEKDPQLEVAICSAYSDYAWDDVLKRTRRPDLQLLRKPFTSEQVLELARVLSERCLRRRVGESPAQ